MGFGGWKEGQKDETWAKCELRINQTGHDRAWVWKDEFSFGFGGWHRHWIQQSKKRQVFAVWLICDRLSEKYGEAGSGSRRKKWAKIWKGKK